MIIYFTGTGNSEYAAKAIADRLGDEPVCSNTYIKTHRKGDFMSEKPYVFVFPVYLSIVPAIFRDFINSSSFKGNRNAYFIPTCASADGSVPNSCKRICEQKGELEFMGSCKVIMPQNYITLFKPTDETEKEERYRNAGIVIDTICDAIKNGNKLIEKPASGFEYGSTLLIEKWYNSCFTKTGKFHATESCVGCGRCAELCPTNSIEIKEGKPNWVNKICIHCMACINRCPKQAIEYGKATVGKTRHVCPQYTKDKN